MYFYTQIYKIIEKDSIKYFNLAFKNIVKKCSAMLSTVSSEMAQKVPNGVRKKHMQKLVRQINSLKN